MRFKSLTLLLALSIAFGGMVATVLPAPARADFIEGKKSYDNKNWRRAIMLLRPLAEKGDARAMVLLGNMYAEGYGVEKDLTEAFFLYRGAAERNNPDGILATATLYQTGSGVPVNTRLAIMWFERGAKMGHQASAFFYAMHLYQGSKGESYDFKPDHVAAYKWFRIAARSRGNPKMARTADGLAEKLREKLDYNDVEVADREVVEWTPTDPRNLGPLPEVVAHEEKEAAAAAGKTGDGSTPGTDAPDAAPEITPEPAPDTPRE